MSLTAPASDASSSFCVILASTSPRRREIMALLNIPFIAVSPGGPSQEVDETPFPNELPAALVQRLSRAKAAAVIQDLSIHVPDLKNDKTCIVIGADTVVVANNKILGKPGTPAEAAQMLKLLRQQPHFVFSGLTAAIRSYPDGQPTFTTRSHQSKVWMRPYTEAEIAAYVTGGSPLDKAGAYGIQDRPFAPVERLEGCFTSVMGMPLGELADMLRQAKLPIPKIGPLCSRYTGIVCCQNLSGVST